MVLCCHGQVYTSQLVRQPGKESSLLGFYCQYLASSQASEIFKTPATEAIPAESYKISLQRCRWQHMQTLKLEAIVNVCRLFQLED